MLRKELFIHQKNKKMKTKVFNLIIVDESGSMSIIRNQAFAGMNETLQTIKTVATQKPEIEQRVTMLTFDSSHTRFHYDNAEGTAVVPLNPRDYNPCGGTPLYDAIGLGIAKVNALAQEGDTVLVTIITDGEENCSQEYTLKMVKTLIEKLKKQEWTFTLIGTDDLDVEGMAQSMGIRHSLSFGRNVKEASAMFHEQNERRERYYDRVRACKMASPTARILDDDEDFFDKKHV